MRGKVLPYYKQLRKTEIALPKANVEQIDAALGDLAKIDTELARRVRVSVTYLPEVYQLRLHARATSRTNWPNVASSWWRIRRPSHWRKRIAHRLAPQFPETSFAPHIQCRR